MSRRYAVALFAIIAFFTACDRHGDLPPMLAVAEPPAPTSFVVSTSDNINFDLSWFVGDDSNVRFYRIFILDPFFGPAVIDTAFTQSAQEAPFPFPTSGLVFGVSTVTNQNVEGRIVYASAP